MTKMLLLGFSSIVPKKPDNGDEPKNSNFEYSNIGLAAGIAACGLLIISVFVFALFYHIRLVIYLEATVKYGFVSYWV